MRVIVTGAAGYLGGHVVERLAKDGHSVTAVLRDAARASPWLLERARVVACDLGGTIEPQALEGHDVCVHLAVLWPDASAQPELDDIGASVRLFDALGRAGIAHVVYTSSAAVHRPFAARMTERDRIVTADAYGAAKAAGEAFLRASAAAHGFRASVVRPGPCVGLCADPEREPKTPQRIAQLLQALVAGQEVRVAEGEGRQLTSCLDLARTIGVVLERPDAPSVLLCMDRAVTTWAEIARHLAVRLGRGELVQVTARAESEPASSFDTAEIERFVGEPLDAHEALHEHIDRLLVPGAGVPSMA